MKVALIHDWLTGMRGGEYVLEALIDLYPQAELFTLLHVPGSVSKKIESLKIHTSPLQKIPGAAERYRYFLPWMPKWAEAFDISGFDLILSSSHCVAKGVRKPPGAIHVSYVHAPMRYIWDRYDEYFGPGRARTVVRAGARVLRPFLQKWDRRVSQEDRVDLLIANSRFIADQIRSAYGREAQVVYPFVDWQRFQAPRAGTGPYLMVGAFAPNKRVDLAIEAFNQMKLPLKIVGSGQDAELLKRMAGPTIEFTGSLSNVEIARAYSECRAFVFPGVEDFGITPLEAMAAGAPVVALGKGGALETVTPQTGVFFSSQTVSGLVEAIQKMEKGLLTFQEAACRGRAREFSKERFQSEFQAWVEKIRMDRAPG